MEAVMTEAEQRYERALAHQDQFQHLAELSSPAHVRAWLKDHGKEQEFCEMMAEFASAELAYLKERRARGLL